MEMSKRKIFLDRDEELYARFCAGEKQKELAVVYSLTESGVKQAVARMRKLKGIEKKKGVRA